MHFVNDPPIKGLNLVTSIGALGDIYVYVTLKCMFEIYSLFESDGQIIIGVWRGRRIEEEGALFQRVC